MTIKIFTKADNAQTLIMPFVKNEQLAEHLLKNAKAINISMEALEEDFKAEKGEKMVISTPGKKFEKIVLLGLGQNPTNATVLQVFRSFFNAEKKKLKGLVLVDLKGHSDLAHYAANGIALASYEIGMLKAREEEVKTVFNNDAEIGFIITANQESQVKEAIQRGLQKAKSQMNMMALVDAPSNYKTPQMMVDYIEKSGKKNGFEVKVYNEKECAKKGFHALLAVGRGSVDRPARMVVMHYKGKGKKVGLVGKGVTFDTGGISLKPGDGMEDMKMDMGGSAAVIGTLELAAKFKLKVNLIGIVALTENSIDALSIKPGDVINSYAGKTIEVINTDAEGRLILADALNFMATEYEPEMMIDLATLTGSCIRSLGYKAAGMMTNNDTLASMVEKAGNETGEKVWRLPLWDEYREELDSDVADIKNLGSAYAGATTAAKFLEFFTEKHPNWAHLDIAGMAYMKTEYAKGASATAYGVSLLTELLENYSKS